MRTQKGFRLWLARGLLALLPVVGLPVHEAAVLAGFGLAVLETVVLAIVSLSILTSVGLPVFGRAFLAIVVLALFRPGVLGSVHPGVAGLGHRRAGGEHRYGQGCCKDLFHDMVPPQMMGVFARALCPYTIYFE